MENDQTIDLPDIPVCPACKGSGEMLGLSYGAGPDDYEVIYECSMCGGTGELPNER